MAQVYAVIYQADGKFLLARKLIYGYFFSEPGGSVVPTGQKLNDPGDYALPGGGRDREESPEEGAAREFKEETGEKIPTNIVDAALTYTGQTQNFDAAYFLWNGSLSGLAQQINERNLPLARIAAMQVQDTTGPLSITNYDGIRQFIAIHEGDGNCPADDELASVEIWDVKNPINWNEIRGWRAINSNKDSYYEILLHLKTGILKLSESFIS